MKVLPLVKPHPVDRRARGTIRYRHLHPVERATAKVGGTATLLLLLGYLAENGHL